MHFLHVGYGKGGSSYLQKYYFVESNGFLNLKSVPLWDEYIQDGLSTAQSTFFRSKTAPEKPHVRDEICLVGLSDEIFLEGGVDYHLKLERWSQLFPDTKVLIVIRNQPDLVYSGYCTHVPDGYFNGPNKYLRELIWDAQDSYFGSLFFDRAYEITKECFDQVLVLPYELLATGGPFVSRLNEFFGMDAEVPDVRVNFSQNDSVISVMRLLNYVFRHGRARPQMTILPSYIIGPTRFDSNRVPGKSPSPNFRKVLNKVAVKLGTKLPVDCSSRQRFYKQNQQIFEDWFGESNRRLEKLVNVDLSQYGYIGTIDKGGN